MANRVSFGSSYYTLDEKNRVRLPANVREVFDSKYFLMPGRTGCLYLVLESEVKSFTEKFRSADKFSDDPINDVATAYAALTYEVKEDAQGRIHLRDNVKEAAGIDKEIVFVVNADYVEIWPAYEYERRCGALNPAKISNMLARLKNRGN